MGTPSERGEHEQLDVAAAPQQLLRVRRRRGGRHRSNLAPQRGRDVTCIG